MASLVGQRFHPAPPEPVAALLISWGILSPKWVLLAPDATCAGCGLPMWSAATSTYPKVTDTVLVCPNCTPKPARTASPRSALATLTAVLAASPATLDEAALRMTDLGVPAELLAPAVQAATVTRQGQAVADRRAAEHEADTWNKDAATLTAALDAAVAGTTHTYDCTSFARHGREWEIKIYLNDGATYAGFIGGTLHEITSTIRDVFAQADAARTAGAPCPTCTTDQWDTVMSPDTSWTCPCGTEFFAVTSRVAGEGVLGEAPWSAVRDLLSLTDDDQTVMEFLNLLPDLNRDWDQDPVVWAPVSTGLTGVLRAEFENRRVWALTPDAGRLPDVEMPSAARIGNALGERGYSWEPVVESFYNSYEHRHENQVVAVAWEHPDRDELVVLRDDQWWVARFDDWWRADLDDDAEGMEEAVEAVNEKWALTFPMFGDWQATDYFPLGYDYGKAVCLDPPKMVLSPADLDTWVTTLLADGAVALAAYGDALHADLLAHLATASEGIS